MQAGLGQGQVKVLLGPRPRPRARAGQGCAKARADSATSMHTSCRDSRHSPYSTRGIMINIYKQVRPLAALASLCALRPAYGRPGQASARAVLQSVQMCVTIDTCHCVALQGSSKCSARPPASWAPQWLRCCQGSGV